MLVWLLYEPLPFSRVTAKILRSIEESLSIVFSMAQKDVALLAKKTSDDSALVTVIHVKSTSTHRSFGSTYGALVVMRLDHLFKIG